MCVCVWGEKIPILVSCLTLMELTSDLRALPEELECPGGNGVWSNITIRERSRICQSPRNPCNGSGFGMRQWLGTCMLGMHLG